MQLSVFKAILYATLAAIVTTILIGVPTALVPNPVFGRMIPPNTTDYVIFAVTIILTAALAATYAWPAACPLPERRLAAGTIATYFAVGCPTCNKLVVLLLGSGGALQWFAPIQPFLGLLGIGLLLSSLLYRGRLVWRTYARRPTSMEPLS